jgi:hypothetical protein
MAETDLEQLSGLELAEIIKGHHAALRAEAAQRVKARWVRVGRVCEVCVRCAV